MRQATDPRSGLAFNFTTAAVPFLGKVHHFPRFGEGQKKIRGKRKELFSCFFNESLAVFQVITRSVQSSFYYFRLFAVFMRCISSTYLVFCLSSAEETGGGGGGRGHSG